MTKPEAAKTVTTPELFDCFCFEPSRFYALPDRLVILFEDPNKIYFYIQLAFLQFNTNMPMNVIFMVV